MSLVVLPPAPRSLSLCRYEYYSQASLRRDPLEEVLFAYRSVHKSILNADKVSSLRSPWPSSAQVPGGRSNDLRRIVSLPLPLFPCQTLPEHFHLPFPLAISRSNRRFVYIQRVRPPGPPHKILETLQRHWKHPLLTDVCQGAHDSEHCGTTLAPFPKPSISPMGFSGAIGQLAGCNLSLDLCAVKFSMSYFLLAGPAV
jgi:hypothetical protein